MKGSVTASNVETQHHCSNIENGGKGMGVLIIIANDINHVLYKYFPEN